jgi:hypothetical protein
MPFLKNNEDVLELVPYELAFLQNFVDKRRQGKPGKLNEYYRAQFRVVDVLGETGNDFLRYLLDKLVENYLFNETMRAKCLFACRDPYAIVTTMLNILENRVSGISRCSEILIKATETFSPKSDVSSCAQKSKIATFFGPINSLQLSPENAKKQSEGVVAKSLIYNRRIP